MGFFLITAAFGIIYIFLFTTYCMNYVEAIKNTPELTYILMIVMIRIFVMFAFAFYMFRKWFRQEARYFKNIPFLIGLFFYLTAMGKIYDISLYII